MKVFSEFNQDLESLWHNAWYASIQPLPFLSFDWHKAYANTFPNEGKPLIFFDESKNCIGSFLQSAEKVTFGGGEEISDYLDLIGPETAKSSCFAEILSRLSQLPVNSIVLKNIPHNSASLDALKQFTIEPEDTTPLIHLPSSWEAYMASLSRKNRHELERKLRKFDREYPNVQLSESVVTPEDMRSFLDLMAKNPNKAVFLTPAMRQFFHELPVIMPTLTQTKLTLDSVMIAAVIGFTVGKNYYLYNSAVDTQAVSGAGFYLNAKSINMKLDQGYGEYNFLQGNERYKYELGGQDFPVMTASLSIT